MGQGSGLIHDLVDAAAERFPHRTAVRDSTGAWSYRELAGASRAAAGWLWRNGVRPGDRVVLHLPGDRHFAALLYGVLRLGAIAVPVNPRTGPLHLRWMCQDAGPALVVTSPGDAAALADLTGTTVTGTAAADLDPLRPPDGPPACPVAPGDIALLLYTSGSTALPRAVVCPHDRVRFVVAAIADRLGYTADDVVLSRIPVSFDYGLYQLLLCAAAGAALALRPDLTEAAVLREARSVGATVLPVVPFLATILVRLAHRDPSPTRVRLLTNTGAALNGPLVGGLRRAFPDAAVVPMYGMTECKRITVAAADEDLAHPGTVGRPLPGTEVLIVDHRGEPVPPGTVGEIWVRGPHVMAGYWRAPDATRDRFDNPDTADRTLRTGDYGYADRDGRLYFVGRRDDIFKRKGIRMSAQEVEAAVLDVPGVVAAAVLPPVADGELTAWIVGAVPPDEVRAAVALRVEPAKVPDRCLVLPELPTTANGKVDKHVLRRLADGLLR
jgi:acyl-CoA synthetase (AMP-forming)/AMP-acid ligase II